MIFVFSFFVLFHSLAVLATAPHHFVFKDVVDRPNLFLCRDAVNEEIDKIHAQDPDLAIGTKKYLESLMEIYLATYRTSEIEERERLEIAYKIMEDHLRPKLSSFKIDESQFFKDLEEMYHRYLNYTDDYGNPDISPLKTFFDELRIQYKSEFTQEQLDTMDGLDPWSFYSCFSLALLQHLMTLKKDHVLKLVFQEKVPISFTGKPLNEAIENLPEILEKHSNKLRLELERLDIIEEVLSVDENAKNPESALDILIKHSLPLVRDRKWLSVPFIEKESDVPIKEKQSELPIEDKQPEGNKNDNGPTNPGLLGDKGKIFAICAVVVIITLVCGGFAFWYLRLRNKNPIAPNA